MNQAPGCFWMFRLKARIAWLSLLICFVMTIQGADKLILCHAKGDHMALEQIEYKVECGKLPASPALSSFLPSNHALSSSTLSIDCCGPCTDIPFSVPSLFHLSACNDLIKSFQTLPADTLSLWNEALTGTTTERFLSDSLTVHDSTHSSLRSTILLI